MIYLFNNNEEMIRIIPSSAIKRMHQTQTLTDENYISDRLSVEIQALNDEELSELEYMAIDDVENPQRFHYYFIVKETTEHQITTLTGVQSGIEELRKTPVYDLRPDNRSPKFIADRLLEGTNWQTGYTTDEVGTLSTNFYYTDVFSALKKMCMAFGIEMQFFVEITANRIGARYIEFRKRTGKSVGKRVVYGHNALKIVKEVEKTNTVTALIGRGKGVQVSESDEGNVGYGRKIGFENVEWKVSSGAPVDKPIGQEFVDIPELTLKHGIKNSDGTVRPKIGFVEFQDEENETRLIERTYETLLELSRPQVLLETSSIYLPDTGIGDTINVIRHDRDLRYQTRVFEITWDRLANQAVAMKLGDRLGESENKRISRISNQVSGNISTELGSTIDELFDRLTTADGKNTNWYTDYDPMENPDTKGLVRLNDNWYQPDPEYEGEVILKQWNGEMWVEILRTSGNPAIVRRFEEVEKQAEELAGEIEASEERATDKANQALQDAKDWASDLEGGLKIHASQITAGEIETARLKVTEIVSQGLSGNEDSVTQLVIGDDVFKSSVTNLAKQKIADELIQEYETITSQVSVVTGNNEPYFGVTETGYNYYEFDLESDIPSGTTVNVKFLLDSSSNLGQQFTLDYINSAGDVENILFMNLTQGQDNVTTSFVANQDYSSDLSKFRLTIYDYSNHVTSFEMWHEVEHEVPIVGQDTGAISSQINQLYNMINLSILGKEGAMSRIAMGEKGIQIDGELLHITAKTYIDDGVIKNAMIDNLSANKITTGTLDAAQLNVVNIDFDSLVGNKTSFLKSLWDATNSRSIIDGTRIRLESGVQGAYVELNNIPEFRSQFHDGTAVVMAKGRTQFFEPNGGSQGYIGRDIHTGTNDFGIFVSRGKGFRIARATDSSSSVDDKFYTVKSGMNWRVAIIEDMVRAGILQDGDSQQFVANSNKIAKLNGWPILPQDWPTLRPGDQVMYEKGKIINDGVTDVQYEDVINFGKNGALTEWWLYMRQHVRFEAGYSSASDRRIKYDIQPTNIGAIETINNLEFKEFKMKRDDRYVPLGLIAQDSGLLRIKDPVNEALNMELATLLSLKGVQELKKEIDDLKEQIKTLQNSGLSQEDI